MRKLLLLLPLLLAKPSLANVYQDAINSSVVIHMKWLDHGTWHRGGCSGTYIDERHILSAAHCFEGSDLQLAWSKDDTGQSNLLMLNKIDTKFDLALLTVIGVKKHRYARLGRDTYVGMPVVCVGSPYGLDFMVSQGIIAKLDLKIEQFNAIYILHTAMINPGSSGGGAFDLHGRLVGVNTMSIGSIFGWAGISAAVDLETIREFLK